MINLEVEEYCHGCRDFESDTYYDYVGEINNISIFCKHKNKCAQLKKYIEKEFVEQSGDTVDSSQILPGKVMYPPIKTRALCKSCVYDIHNGKRCHAKPCKNCDLHLTKCADTHGFNCYCSSINNGDPCLHFKEAKNET